MIRRPNKGVSPIIGVLLLLGVSVALLALASNVFFSTLDVNASPNVELETTHKFVGGGPPPMGFDPSGGNNTEVEIRVVRNINVDTMTYVVEDSDNNREYSKEFSSTDPGHVERFSAQSGDTVVILGEVSSNRFVLETYQIPEEGI